MTLTENYVPRNIEKVFHLPRDDQYVKITYEQAKRWYRDNEKPTLEMIQSSFFIDWTPVRRRAGKVDMTRGYMKDDFKYTIVLLSWVMAILENRHLNIWMVHFIDIIKIAKMPIDWATILSDNLHEQLVGVQVDPIFYMTSYMVYLLAARMTNYLGLYKKGACKMIMHGLMWYTPNSWRKISPVKVRNTK